MLIFIISLNQVTEIQLLKKNLLKMYNYFLEHDNVNKNIFTKVYTFILELMIILKNLKKIKNFGLI